MKPAIGAGLLLGMIVFTIGCGTGEVSYEQQKAKQAALQKVADEDTTHAKQPGRDR